MESIQVSNSAASVRILKLDSPNDLRLIADRLEAQVKNSSLPGDTIFYPISKNITIMLGPISRSIKIDEISHHSV